MRAVGVDEFEVVIAGAGPAGLASAATLGSYGVETLVVERRLSPSTLPRANTASTGTMELLRRWGIEREARERSLDVEFRAWSTPTLAAADQGEAIEVGFPTREQASLISPTAPAAIGQDELEPILEAHVRSLASVRVERGIELVSLEPGNDGGHILTLGGPGDRSRRVRATYVIGADGMQSKVREELGIATQGEENLAQRLGIHFRAPLWELLEDRRYVIYFLTEEPEARIFVPVGQPDRWVFAMHWESSAGAAAALSGEQLTRWVQDAVGARDLAIEIDRAMPVTYGVALAERFRQDDAFLVGDAAHRVTPRGATGLNTAIRDGFDLGWKLAWALRGWAGARLLDTYEPERRPVAEFNTRRSSKSDGSVLGNRFGLNADIGGRIAHGWVARDGAAVSTIDLLGDGFTLFVGPDWDGPIPEDVPASPPVTVERLDAVAARGLGLTTVGSLLARPDGQPAALWNDGESSPARLAREIAAGSGAARPPEDAASIGQRGGAAAAPSR